MKANEAPEKIYKTTTYLDERKNGVVKWKDKPIAGAENIEYIRSDAFIEKATLWLLTNASDYCILHNSYDTKELVKDFVNAMKRD